jgi:hypothetical protein
LPNISAHTYLHQQVPDVCHEYLQVLFHLLLIDLHKQVDVGAHW